MRYLNESVMHDLSAEAFLAQKPFPWMNPHGLLTDWGYQDLLAHMPEMSLYEKDFGFARKYGQPPHDRYRLWYEKAKDAIPDSWKEFISELDGKEYRQFIADRIGVKKFILRMEWHATPSGCFVSPHLDGYSTHGTHIFYFNPEGEWDPAWGGGTLVLDQGDKNFGMQSNPKFEDFDRIIEPTFVGNYSIMFKNQWNAFHGVKEIQAPEGKYRRMFSIFMEEYEPLPRRAIKAVKRVLRPMRDALIGAKSV